jgi:hypothetical protein
MDDNSDAKAATRTRLMLPAILWVVRISLGASDSVTLLPACIVLDAALAAGHWWANRPMEVADPKGFGWARSWTGWLIAPITLALVLLVYDTIAVIHSP